MIEIARVRVSGTHARCKGQNIPLGLIGGYITISYEDPIWNDLVKTVVFRGSKTINIVTEERQVAIPYEVLQKKAMRIYVGFYGTNVEGKKAIPTFWAEIGTVVEAADPSGDEAADPTLPIWAQIQDEIKQLKESVVFDDSKLNDAINSALEEAKNSGEFNGPTGKSAYQYAKEGGYTGTEEEFTEMMANGSGGSAFDPTVYGLPVLHLAGDTAGMSKDNAVTMDYVYGERSGTASVKWQGSSSLSYPKKNYTIKFDNAFEAFDGWGAQKKYCLKANWIDHSHARNVVSAKLWGEVVKSRENTNAKLSVLPNGGAVDGFPCIIMLNGDFHGLYTFNIPKDGWLYGMNDDEAVEQMEVLPFKTCISENWPDLNTAEYTATSKVGTAYVTSTSNLTGGRTYVNWDTTQMSTFTVLAYLFDATGALVKIFAEKGDSTLSPYYKKSGDFGEDAWFNCPLTTANPFMVTGPFSLPVPAGHRVMWVFRMVTSAALPEGSSLTHTWSAEAEANNTWTYTWARTGVEFSVRNNSKTEIIVCADTLSDATKFKTEATFSGDFEVAYASDTVNDEDTLSSLNRLINACINSDGTDLDSNIANYLDWDSAIDYYIFACLIGAADAAAKNYLLYTYDGTKWGFGAYDLDTTFGIWWNGQRFLPSDHYPTVQWYANYHRVMGLILNYKKEAFKARYAELRAGALSENNVALAFSNFINKIPSTIYMEDAKKWPGIPSTAANNLAQLLDWYRMRVSVLDKEVESIT